jgi:hypothetical protein
MASDTKIKTDEFVCEFISQPYYIIHIAYFYSLDLFVKTGFSKDVLTLSRLTFVCVLIFI